MAITISWALLSGLAAPASDVEARTAEVRSGRGKLASARRAPAAPAMTVNRNILALFDGAEEGEPSTTRIHRLLEMPLNHLGYKVTYWDLRKGLPPVVEAMTYRAVATWFNERIADPAAYLAWAGQMVRTQVKFVIMEFPGVPLDAATLPDLNVLLGHIGVAIRPEWVASSPELEVITADPSVMGFEHKLTGELPGYMVYRPTSERTRTMIEVGRPRHAMPSPSTPVVTGPGGGFAAYGYAKIYDQQRKRLAWVLDPFKFLRSALGVDEAPIPDTTTLVGRRIYFSHIDGDAWNNPSLVDVRVGRGRHIVSEIVRDRLVAPYPDLPVSIGLVASDADPALGGTQRAADVARSLFAMPQVEVASHTYTHPYNWGFYETDQRAQEIALVEARRNDPQRVAGSLSAAGVDKAFLSGSAEAPRANMLKPFDLDMEIRQALDMSRRLAPIGKSPALYLWSGNTRPFAAAIRATRDYGVRNLNGGDGRLDSLYPSIAYLSAVGRIAGGERQIYAPNANETIYTGGWVAPFDRFAMLAETLRNTELPRRLKPWNVYYHMYSGQHEESVAAVKAHLDAARAAPVTPIRASEYAAIADGFFDAAVVQIGPRAWRIEGRGALATVRFDDADDSLIDWRSSAGVLGASRHGGSLYVALDPANLAPVVALITATAATQVTRPHLIESRWQVSALQLKACGLSARASGFGPGEMWWGGFKRGRYRVRLTGAGSAEVLQQVEADETGNLRLALQSARGEPRSLDIDCVN